MESVSNFVDGMGFGFDEFSILECFFFKEEADVMSWFGEIIMKVMISGFGIKNGDLLGGDLEMSNEVINLLNSGVTLLWWNKAGNDRISIF